jgi:hypothetical protein
MEVEEEEEEVLEVLKAVHADAGSGECGCWRNPLAVTNSNSSPRHPRSTSHERIPPIIRPLEDR